MVDEKSIYDFSSQIARKFRPEKIILFGSYTQGTATDDSDVDLLVILPFEGKPIRKASEILRKTRPRIPVELLVRTPEQVKTRLALNDYFLHEVMNTGRVLYESLTGEWIEKAENDFATPPVNCELESCKLQEILLSGNWKSGWESKGQNDDDHDEASKSLSMFQIGRARTSSFKG